MAKGRARSPNLFTSCPPEGCEHIALSSLPWQPATNPSAPLAGGLVMDNCTSWPGFPAPTLPLTHAEPICPIWWLGSSPAHTGTRGAGWAAWLHWEKTQRSRNELLPKYIQRIIYLLIWIVGKNGGNGHSHVPNRKINCFRTLDNVICNLLNLTYSQVAAPPSSIYPVETKYSLEYRQWFYLHL